MWRRKGGRLPALLAKHLLVRLFVKSHEQGFSATQRRGTEVTTGPDQQCGQRLPVRPVLFQIEMRDLLALGNIHVANLSQQRRQISDTEPFFPGVGFLSDDEIIR